MYKKAIKAQDPRKKESQKGKGITLTFLILILIVAFFSIVLLTYSFYYMVIIDDIYSIPINVKVSDYTGFNVERTSLNFGTLMPGSSGSRTMSIHNTKDYPIKVIIKNKGPLADYIYVSDNLFILKPEQIIDINYTLYVPRNTSQGNYTPESIITLKRFFIDDSHDSKEENDMNITRQN